MLLPFLRSPESVRIIAYQKNEVLKGEVNMAFTSHRTRFKGNLAGIEQERLSELDFTLTSLKDRQSFIDKKYEMYGAYYDEYIDEYYKVGLNTTDDLSENINVFRTIERDADYLLNSCDLPRDRQQQYKFYTKAEFEALLKKEKRNQSMDSTAEVIDILEPNNGNYYLDTSIEIKNSDFKDEKIGEILTSYDNLRQVLKEEMRKIKNKEESRYDLGFVKRNLGSVKSDMIDSKRILKGILRPSTKTVSSKHEADYDWLDYKDPGHVKVLLSSIPFGEIRPDAPITHIAYDMEVALKQLHKEKLIDDTDHEIAMLLNSGETERSIAEIIGKGKTTVRQRVDKICKKIAWYYS